MKPKSVVTCFPSQDLEKARTFYSKCFQLEDLQIEEGMFTVELGNLSLFVMSQDSYEQYIQKLNLRAGYPQDSVQSLHSCAVTDPAMIEHLFAVAEEAGGTVAQPMRQNEWGQHAGYLRDPDGHLWEIVQIAAS